MINDVTLKVSEYNELIKNVLESEILLANLWVVGEISNLRLYQGGKQVYFSLTDPDSQIQCVLYDIAQKNLKFELKEGVLIRAKGKLRVFQKKGTYTLQVSWMDLVGAGAQDLALAKLKEKLSKEGLFNPENKVPIPRFPENVALITSQDSAAQWDFVSQIQAHAPHITMTLIPATMQGFESAKSVIAALDIACSHGFDCIVLLRGGGSQEDLASFNDETLVRKVAEVSVPVIAAIGHEIDYTLTDFVADLRCPTPTAAALTIATPTVQFMSHIPERLWRAGEIIRNQVLSDKNTVKNAIKSATHFLEKKQDLSRLKWSMLSKRLEAANPLRKMRQGFSMTRLKETGKIVRDVSQVQPGEKLVTTLAEGWIESEVLLSSKI